MVALHRVGHVDTAGQGTRGAPRAAGALHTLVAGGAAPALGALGPSGAWVPAHNGALARASIGLVGRSVGNVGRDQRQSGRPLRRSSAVTALIPYTPKTVNVFNR